MDGAGSAVADGVAVGELAGLAVGALDTVLPGVIVGVGVIFGDAVRVGSSVLAGVLLPPELALPEVPLPEVPLPPEVTGGGLTYE